MWLIDRDVKKFYFVRHGQTEANAHRILSGGGCDIDLSEQGVLQAKNLADNCQIWSDAATICCSPLIRARRTADIINCNWNLPLIELDGLKEWVLGDWEGNPLDDQLSILTTKEDPPKGEKRADFECRLKLAFHQAFDYAQPILIVAHGIVGYTILKNLGLNPQRLLNAVPYCFEIINQKGNEAQINPIHNDRTQWKLTPLLTVDD